MTLTVFRRFLRHARGLSIAVAGMLALGVGAVTTTFALVDAAIFRAPPFRDAERIVMLYTTHSTPREAEHNERWAYQRLRLLRSQARSFADVANYSPTAVTLTGTDAAEPLRGEFVSPSYFRVLGVDAALGRVLLDQEDGAPGAHRLAVLSHELWQRRFGSDPAIAGRTIGINGVPLTIVGVMPAGFRGLSDRAQLWMPASMAPRLTYDQYLVSDQNFISAVARLGDGVSLTVAQAEMRALGARLYQAIPFAEAEPGQRSAATAVSLGEARVAPELRTALAMLFAAVALLYLLACANVVSLLLGTAVARRREAAVRKALGARPVSLFALFFGEGVLLALAGGALGILLASWAVRLVVVPTSVWGPRHFYGSLAAFADATFSWRVLAFGVVLTVVTAALVAWGPAVSATRVDLAHGLRDGARGTATGAGSLRRPSARGIIVAVETALAVLLLVAGGLMIDSFARMVRTDLGVDADHVLTFAIQPSDVAVPPDAAPAFIRRVLGAITSVPGVVSATVDGGAPVGGTARSTLVVMGRPVPPPEMAPPVLRHYVAPEHFATLGIPLRRGRTFTDQDVAGRPRVAVISETAARRFWPNEDPIGQRVWFHGGSSFDRPDSSAEIVGVVGDVMYEPLDTDPNRASFYTPYAQFTYSWRIYFVRTVGDPVAVLPAIRDAVRAVSTDLPLTEVQTLRERIGDSWARHRFDAWFFGTFAVVALLLSASGIFAVVAYAVGQRTREMGVRLALGASPRAVVRLVVREGMLFPMLGLTVGGAAAFAAAGLLRASLYGVSPTDARVFMIAIAVLALVAVIACLVPARRATRIDPCQALRVE